jgi:hypothetical protein
LRRPGNRIGQKTNSQPFLQISSIKGPSAAFTPI